MTARATTRAAASVISPYDRFSSWEEGKKASLLSHWQKEIQNYHIKSQCYGQLTLRTGSPSLTTAARAMAPSERTRQSPKLTTCRFLRCLRAYADSRGSMSTANTNTLTCRLLGRPADGTHLCHSQRSLFGKSVVVEVQDAELAIVPHRWSQGHHPCVVDSILGHVHFFQAANELRCNTGC